MIFEETEILVVPQYVHISMYYIVSMHMHNYLSIKNKNY